MYILDRSFYRIYPIFDTKTDWWHETTQKANHDDRWQYSKKIVKCLTTTRSKKELCIFAGKIDKKSSSYCCLRSFGRSGNKFPAIKSISNTALDTTICLVAHFSKAVGTGDTRGQLTPHPLFWQNEDLLVHEITSNVQTFCSFTPDFGRNRSITCFIKTLSSNGCPYIFLGRLRALLYIVQIMDYKQQYINGSFSNVINGHCLPVLCPSMHT